MLGGGSQVLAAAKRPAPPASQPAWKLAAPRERWSTACMGDHSVPCSACTLLLLHWHLYCCTAALVPGCSPCPA